GAQPLSGGELRIRWLAVAGGAPRLLRSQLRSILPDYHRERVIRADSTGRFAFAALAVGDQALVTARRHADHPWSAPELSVAPESDLCVQLRPGRLLRGRLAPGVCEAPWDVVE